jgi:hypothetical protein
MRDTGYDAALDEINSARNAVEKDMLLQKHGFIPPKLTELERLLIYVETEGLVQTP